MAQPLPTPLERFRENHRECRGVAAARQYSRTFSASGKSLNLWALILSPTYNSKHVVAAQFSSLFRTRRGTPNTASTLRVSRNRNSCGGSEPPCQTRFVLSNLTRDEGLVLLLDVDARGFEGLAEFD